ncbi:MAG: DNA translocase FtsK [Chloroflexota bacterium]
MAKRRDSIKRSYRKPFLLSPVFRRVLLLLPIVAVAVVILWQWQAVTSWSNNALGIIWGLFGWGIAFLALVLLVIVALVAGRKPYQFLRRLYRLLGVCALIASFWGILGWFELGGDVGSYIIGATDRAGLLRIVGLDILGVLLLAPGAIFRGLANLATAFKEQSTAFKVTVLVVFLVSLVMGVLLWQRSAVTAWGNDFAREVWGIFGWGLLLSFLALITAIGALKKRQLSYIIELSKARHWNRWLGGLVMVIAVWGLLALFSLGGRLGEYVTGSPVASITGLLRVFGLFALSIVLMVPGPFLNLLRLRGVSLDVGKTMPVPRVRSAPRSAEVTEWVAPITPSPRPRGIFPPRRATVSRPPVSSPPAPALAPQPETLKQVTQEVWKKYGETTETGEGGWRLPPLDLLDKVAEVELSEAENLSRAKLIEDAMKSYGVEAKVVQINVGPTVTQFGVEPGWDRKTKEIKEKDKDGVIKVRTEEVDRTRVKVERITSLANDLALALAASSIRIEAPVPGKSVVGIEVPNTVFSIVSLRSVIESSGFQKLKVRSPLTIALGKGAGGEALSADLSKMPHLLIAGATGSGKTICLNAVICCLLLHNTPEDVRFIMIDPKRVELTQYNGIPHMAAPVIVDVEKAIGTLRWLNAEMDSRYKKMALASVRNIEGYNKTRTGKDRMPYLVLVIDELADLMMTGYEEVEHILCRLAQLARATGIHLVVATQRPSVDVVTGLIKANFPTRISFAVTSQVDSRTILDAVGAEKLLGRGDMLYMPTDAAKPKRLQGCFVSDAEIERLVFFWGKQKELELASLNVEELAAPRGLQKGATPADPLLEQVRKLAEEHETISVSYIQRQLHIGYNRAARLWEELQKEREGEGGEKKETKQGEEKANG